MNTPHEVFEFGPFRLNATDRVLLREGRPVALPLKAIDVLLVLVRRAGRVVDKETLLKEVWQDTFVEEANLSRQVWTLRKALENGEPQAVHIETVPKRGYRFAAPVASVSEAVAIQHRATTRTGDEGTRLEDWTEKERPPRVSEPALGLAAPRSGSRWLAVVAVTTLAISAATVVIWRGKPTPGLAPRHGILLADFENSTGDQGFDETLRAALAVSLEQSPFLQMVPEPRVRETLRLMTRPDSERLTPAVAREIAQRVGARAVLSGTIDRVDGSYVLTVAATEPGTSRTLARVQANAASKEEVLAKLRALAANMRGVLGEAKVTVDKFDAPLQEATTSSLDALKAFSAGRVLQMAGKHDDAIAQFRRALELDAEFALAHTQLSIAYGQVRERKLSAEHARKAFDLRARATERERLHILVRHQSTSGADYATRIATLVQLRDAYPRDDMPRRALADLYLRAGRFDLAVHEARVAIELAPQEATAHSTLSTALMSLNRLDEARTLLEQAVTNGIASTAGRGRLFEVAVLSGDSALIQQQLDWATAQGRDATVLQWKANIADYRGRRHEARDLYHRSIAFERAAGLSERPAETDLTNISRDAVVGVCAGVSARVNRALQIARNDNTLSLAGLSLAVCGLTDEARRVTAEYRRGFHSSDPFEPTVAVMQAAAESSAGNHAAAVENVTNILQEVTPFQTLWPQYIRAWVYLRGGAPRRAQEAFQKIVDHRGAAGLSIRYPLSYLGLARAAVAAGDLERGRNAYAQFLEMWREGDHDLPVLQQARTEYERLKAMGSLRPGN